MTTPKSFRGTGPRIGLPSLGTKVDKD